MIDTALILAGGYGTRLGALTRDMPKPLLKVGDQSVIEGIIQNLKLYGVNKIIVNLHYLPDKMTNRLQDNVLYYYEPKLLGHEQTISTLQNFLPDEFYVINADTLTNLNYSQMAETHKKGTITACMDQWRCTGTWIYSKGARMVVPYRPAGLEWKDIGIPSRLKEARSVV